MRQCTISSTYRQCGSASNNADSIHTCHRAFLLPDTVIPTASCWHHHYSWRQQITAVDYTAALWRCMLPLQPYATMALLSLPSLAAYDVHCKLATGWLLLVVVAVVAAFDVAIIAVIFVESIVRSVAIWIGNSLEASCSTSSFNYMLLLWVSIALWGISIYLSEAANSNRMTKSEEIIWDSNTKNDTRVSCLKEDLEADDTSPIPVYNPEGRY